MNVYTQAVIADIPTLARTIYPGLDIVEYGMNYSDTGSSATLMIPDGRLIAIAKDGRGGKPIGRWLVPPLVTPDGAVATTDDPFRYHTINEWNKLPKRFKIACGLRGLPVVMYPKQVCYISVTA